MYSNDYEDMVYEIITLKGLTAVHTQIEHRKGLVFMRAKKRPAVVITRKVGAAKL